MYFPLPARRGFFEAGMIVSRCCKKPVFVHSADEGTAYYVCKACHRACDTIDDEFFKDDVYDTLARVSLLSNLYEICLQ